MVYFPRFQWNVYHRIDGMLLASSKYGKHQLAFKPIRKRAHIFWMSNKLSGCISKSVLSSRSLLKVTLWDIFPRENLSEYLKIMVSNLVLWGDWLRSIYQIHKKKMQCLLCSKKFTYKPGVCLALYQFQIREHVILIEKIMSTPIESLQFHYLPWISCTSCKCFESTNHCIHVIQ